MKPPPRKRSNPRPKESVLMRSGQWQRAELQKLLNGLKRLSRTAREHGDIDHAALRKHVPTRSVTEIQSVVNSLKDKVISCASFKLKKRRWEERKAIKPIEVWTHMASSVAGNLEETINTAFAQMLVVSSTEPRTLRNCDPPQLPRPHTDQSRPAGRTVPFRPMPRSTPGQGVRPGSSPAPPLLVLKTPAPTMGPARRLQAPSQVVRVPNSQVPPPQPANKPGASAAPSCLTAATAPPQPAPQTPVTPVAGAGTPRSDSAAALKNTQKPSEQQPSPSAPSLTPLPTRPLPSPLSSPPAALNARCGRSSPRVSGVKCVVDFERLYRYLSVILKPGEQCHLTPMEGAIMLDLLMSLPEELPQLDCNKLQEHLKQVYQSLSSPADSRTARDMFKDLQGGLCAHTDTPGGPDGQQNPAGPADTQSGAETPQPQEARSQSSASSNMSSRGADVTAACPPLNPFIVPLNLLKRRKVRGQRV
uniref:snRNA-activating protein complex subunit 2 n=1 Tax=Semicossyphus pulcher TaxID=241346 RepID=UPI0037E76CF3